MSIFGLASGELYRLVLVVVCLDVAFEILCAGAFVWLAVVGIKERKRYLELSRIRLEDIPITSG